jgi:hypothetical protein
MSGEFMTARKGVLVHLRPAKSARALAGKQSTAKHKVRAGVAGRKSSPEATNALSVGLWDLGAWLGSVLPPLVRRTNRVQGAFRFFEVTAAIPSGMIRPPEGIVEWLRTVMGSRSAGRVHWSRRRRSIIVFEDFRPLADTVRKELGIDYLVGISPSMVAGGDKKSNAYWDYFSQSEGRVILASTYELRAFSSRTSWPFEAYLAEIIVSELLRACSRNLDSHDDRGCLFDFNDDRAGLMTTLDNLHIEPECLKAIRPSCRSAALALVKFMRSLKSEPTE